MGSGMESDEKIIREKRFDGLIIHVVDLNKALCNATAIMTLSCRQMKLLERVL